MPMIKENIKIENLIKSYPEGESRRIVPVLRVWVLLSLENAKKILEIYLLSP